MLEELLIPDLRLAIIERDWPTVAEFCTIIHPSLIAQLLVEADDSELVWSAFAQIDQRARTLIFEYLPEELQDHLVLRLPKPELAGLLEMMSHDDRVDLVKRMDDDQQALIMPLVARADREDILRLSKYEEGTAGSIMTTDYVALPADLSVESALNRIRREAPDRETIYYIFVIDSERRLIGFLSLKDLILAGNRKRLDQIMREDVMFVPASMNVEKVAALLAQYDLIAIPVVDDDRKLVGIITHDDVIDVVIEEATEDVHRMGAVEPLEEGYLDSPFWATVRKRVVWLGLLFGAEMFTSMVLDAYEQMFRVFILLVVFMPVITATGGNTGSQAASLITRAIALGEVTLADWWRIAWRELLSGVVLGGAVGLLGVAAVFFFRAHTEYAIVLLSALLVVTTCGSLIGSLMPLFFKRIGMDPAISSGPFVSSMVDVFGMLIYCTIAFNVLSSPSATIGMALDVDDSSDRHRYLFTVVYADNAAIDVSTLSNANIAVTGPKGFSQLAALVSVKPTGNGTPRRVTYSITPPDGQWNAAHNGTYTITLEADQVRDIQGNVTPPRELGKFEVELLGTDGGSAWSICRDLFDLAFNSGDRAAIVIQAA